MNSNRLLVSLTVLFFALSCGSQSRVITTKKEQDKYGKKEVKIVYNDGKDTSQSPSKVEPKPETPIADPGTKGHPNTVEEYITLYSGIAKEEMQKYGIPASITLAQGILESGAGKSELAVKANNHFGIKCHNDWSGERAYRSGDTECFRKYRHAISSFEDHSLFLKRPRYEFLFSLPKDDYKAWAKGLKAAGYATDGKYPEKLISLIERYQLYKYDTEVLTGVSQQPVKAEPSSGETKEKIHIVKEGDTLYSISRQYGISVEALMEMNGLTSSIISIGQSLKVKDSK